MEQANSLMSQGSDSQKIQFNVSCRNLTDLDFITVTDSYLIVKLMQHNKPIRTILKTKTYMNDLNPDYYESFIIDYFFEIKQKLYFEVYHQANPPKLVGKIETSVGEVFGSKQNRLIKSLLNLEGQQSGKIIIRCQTVQKNNKNIVEFGISALKLPDLTFFFFFGGTNAFFRLKKKRNNQNYLVYESETIQNSRNPKYKSMKFTQKKLCENNRDYPIVCQFYNYSDTGNHELIGQITFTLNQLQQKNHFDLMKKNKKVANSEIVFQNVKQYKKYQFGDFLMGGLQIQLICCVDFTGSNGVANRPQSLHYIGSNKRTAYEEAINAVGEILMDYDSDKLVPIYGFGAKVKLPNFNTHTKVHHCFPLNGNFQNPQVFQLAGMLQTYRKCIAYLEFSGPTLFAPLLSQAMEKARNLKQVSNQYMIILILTDGDIHDEKQVCHLLVGCSRLPISIIIVGIGDGDFQIMERIDDDDMQMTDKNGKRTERDLVQFVPFRKFGYNGVQLAREVLQELPRQVQQYHSLCGITPQQIQKYPTDIQIQKVSRISSNK